MQVVADRFGYKAEVAATIAEATSEEKKLEQEVRDENGKLAELKKVVEEVRWEMGADG